MAGIGTARVSWDFPRSAAGSRGLVASGSTHGVPIETMLAGTRMTPPVLEDLDALVQADEELAIARNLVAAVGDVAGLGIEVGCRYTVASMGIYGFAMLSSATLREAITTALQFVTLSSAFVRMRLTESGQVAVLTVDDAEIPSDIRTFLTERDLSAILHILLVSFGDAFTTGAGTCVESNLDEARCRVLADVFPGLTVAAGQPVTRVVFPRQQLDQPLPTSDPVTARMCAQHCEDLLQRRQRRGGLASAVQARMLRDPRRIPPIQEVALGLGLSERSLRRRLAADNTSYQQLLDETREALATELLATTDLSVEQIAGRLGYAESASFTRAFQRWRGVPPGRYRRVPQRP